MSQPLLMKMHVSRLENAMFGRNHAYLMTLYRCPMSIPQQQVLKKPNSLNFLLHSKAILSCSPFWWSLRRLLTLGSKKVCRSEYYITKYSCFDLFDFDTCTFGIESTYLIFGKIGEDAILDPNSEAVHNFESYWNATRRRELQAVK